VALGGGGERQEEDGEEESGSVHRQGTRNVEC
jgi:hypothetical protein